MEECDLDIDMAIAEREAEPDNIEDIASIKDAWRCERCEHIFKLRRGKKPVECPGCRKSIKKTNFEALTGPFRYFDERQDEFIPYLLGMDIKNSYNFFVHPQSDEVYYFDGKIYRRDGEKIIKAKAQERLHRLVKNKYIKETEKWVQRCEDIRPKMEDINKSTYRLTVKNGILDLKKRELERHDPKALHITKIPWRYDPDASLGLIEDFLYDIVEDEDVKLLQEMFGYCLTKSYPLAKAFMLYGSGANGKSTLLTLLEKFLGSENIANPSLHNLLYDKFSKIELYGKLANIHNDISSSQLNKTGSFKMLTGGDRIEGQRKYKDPIRFKNHAKLIYACNQLPSTDDNTKAFFRRWILIDFPYVFDEFAEDTDPNILEKMITDEQMSGLFNWALDGLDRIQERKKFSTSENREEIEQRWLRESDSIQSFFDECVEVDLDHWISKKDLRGAYKIYCSDLELDIETKKQMTTRGPQIIPRTSSPNDYRPKAHDGSRPHAWRNIRLCEEFYENHNYSPDYTSFKEEQIENNQNILEVERGRP